MADQNVPDALLLEQRVIDRQHCAARIAEDHLDAQVLQRPDQYLRSAHFTGRHHKLLFRRSAERRRRYLLKYSASTLLCVTLLQTVAGPSGLYNENAAPLSGAALDLRGRRKICRYDPRSGGGERPVSVPQANRTEEGRVGEGWVGTCRS